MTLAPTWTAMVADAIAEQFPPPHIGDLRAYVRALATRLVPPGSRPTRADYYRAMRTLGDFTWFRLATEVGEHRRAA